MQDTQPYRSAMSLQAGPGRQLPLDLEWPRKRALGRADFIEGECNAAAAEMVDLWPHWPDRRLLLCGPEASGKTHLAAIWAAEKGATFIDPAGVTPENLREVAALERIVLEDADRALDGAGDRAETERALLHLMNVLGEAGGSLLVTARQPPTRWAVGLPDLASRLRAIVVFEVRRPDETLMSQLVMKLFDDRSVAIQPQVARFLALRLERDFATVARAVERLDRRSVVEKRPVTFALIKDEFEW